MELTVPTLDVDLPATLTLPDGPVRGGLVPLHGANCGNRDYFLYEHIADALSARGIAVLRFDRRDDGTGHDIPFDTQAADARAAMAVLREQIDPTVPIGLFGYSQGGWAATRAAATYPADVAFVVSLSSPGVSPGEQMRFGLANQLRANGYADALGELSAFQDAFYAYLRGESDLASTRAAMGKVSGQPWWSLTGWPTELPDVPGTELWRDVDYDPVSSFEELRCPVLTLFGETDVWVPVDETILIWCEASDRAGRPAPEVVRLDGCDHSPTFGGELATSAISPQFTKALTDWVDGQLG